MRIYKLKEDSTNKAIEGRDYIKVFENKNSEGTEYLYLPLTWNGSKYLASNYFLPKIKVPSKGMKARDFLDNTAKDTDSSQGAKWCISLWTIPDLVIMGEPITDDNGKELRHEGKKYWLEYTDMGYYFLFYFRDYNNLDDINKKIALILEQGSSKIMKITLANEAEGKMDSDIERVQEYWNEHYREYEPQIEHIQEVSIKEKPEFDEYEKQKGEEARDYYNPQKKEPTLKKYFIYNESTGRYDSKEGVDRHILQYLIKGGEFTVPLGVINGEFHGVDLGLKTLKNGPIEVTEDFYCSHNKLTTLKGSPKKVGGDFICVRNQLTTLEGATQEIGGGFYCFENQLTTLEYAPEYVGGDFDCFNNKLTTLEGAPEYIGGDFNCSSNNLTTLEGAPKRVKGNFYCKDNPLQSKELSTKVGKKKVY